MTTRTNTDHELKSLIIHINDSVKGFEKAAERASDENTTLATYFNTQARERSVFADSLNKCFAEDDHERGSAEGSAHRALISVKDMFTSDDPDSIVKEALRGEEKLADYIGDTFSDSDAINPEAFTVITELRQHVAGSISTLRAKLD